MPKEAQLPRRFRSGSIDLRATGNNVVLDAITGKTFLATKAWLEILSSNGSISTNPVVSLGTNTAPFDNLMPNTTVPVASGLANDCQVFELPLGSINPATYVVGRRWKRLDIGSTSIQLRVSTAAAGGTATVVTGRLWLEGHLQ